MAEFSFESGAGKRRRGISTEGHAALSGAERLSSNRVPPKICHFPIVAIGASAGGLEAAIKLMGGLPADTGMAFILVQHLDPTHESMLVELLAEHSAMKVVQATSGAPIEPDHLYVIPPGRYLSVRSDALHLSPPQALHGVRLPFDFLITSLTQDYGPCTACIILSGTGADGSAGLSAFKEQGGFIIAQDPDEAQYDGMPRSAIQTGFVDAVLKLDRMPEALTEFGRRVAALPDHPDPSDRQQQSTGLSDIIAFLHKNTPHDFRLYKTGTLERRIQRRLRLATIKAGDMRGYLQLLHNDPDERDLLAKDLLINVTRFFRDPQIFDTLGKTFIPDLLDGLKDHQALRIWVPGCSSGEEAYSIAMICRDAITAGNRDIKLQVFASDIDPDAIATAREGLYPESIATDVPPDRLSRFFVKENSGGYRIVPVLRRDVVFSVQDLLVDPPFSRINLVSCRNLLIYLNAEAQAKAIGLFHFALREQGILLLGSAETAGNVEGRFEMISKTERIYRHVARSRSSDPGFPLSFGENIPALAASIKDQVPTQTNLADLCRQKILETYAPAAVLINDKRQCLYMFGPTDRYLRVAPGYPSLDLLAMASPTLRTKLRLAIGKVSKDMPRVNAGRSRLSRNGATIWFNIDVQFLTHEGEELLLICFIEESDHEPVRGPPRTPAENSRIADLELELDATQAELQTAIQNQEAATQEQKAIHEEALSVNEEFQSTNEELLTSKEELQSLNEELTALNFQLQETLDRQRTTADDLQNILYSTNVATLFLDLKLRIRFFTPATRSIFNVIPGDIGRPLADLHSLAADEDLLADAQTVLASKAAIEREIK
ncbi:MAG: PAS domain-containing protein, partial [Alphaproteobacteria bacterium]|nr:PAS domain-containing protein [Alphaproteobacteria bacterium]